MIKYPVSYIYSYILKSLVSLGFFSVYIVLFGSAIYAYELDLQNELVTDQANILTAAEELKLESMLLDIESEHKAQIAIVTLQTLDGEDAADVAIDIAESNGIWKDRIDSGALILISVQERKWRIETGYGLEWPIPDILANRIGENVLVPAFRAGDYAWGLVQAVTIMWDLLDGEFDGFVEPEIENIVDTQLYSTFLVYGAMAMFFFGTIYRGIQKSESKRAKWIFAWAVGLWVIALLVLWGTALILMLIYMWAWLFGWFVQQSPRGLRWWRRWFGGFWWWGRRGSSFGWWWFGGFWWWSFGGGGAWWWR